MSDSAASTHAGRSERKLAFRGGGFVIEQRTWIGVAGFVALIATFGTAAARKAPRVLHLPRFLP